MKRLAALLLLAAGVAVFFIGEPGVDRMTARASDHLDAELASRAWHIDPAELLGLMHGRQVELDILDVRDEAEYNLFHLADARRVPPGDEGIRWIEGLPGEAVKVLVDRGETQADRVWKRARAVGAQNIYILEGGVSGWLELYSRRTGAPTAFVAAVGARHGAAFPPADWLDGREFETKVKVVKPTVGPTGGCGG
jgi:rhodanese-related sulfurtransferase